MSPVSMVVHSYNEADALRRLILSSLPLAGLFDEWVVVDHRSDDHTGEVCGEMEGVLADRGVRLDYTREERDLSKSFTFADLRNQALGRCTRDVLVLLDADFLFCRSFGEILTRSAEVLRAKGSRYYGAGFNIPVVWHHLTTDGDGRITDHGGVWIHSRRPRILVRGAIECRQDKAGGMWEAFAPIHPGRKKRYHWTKQRPHLDPDRVGIVSVNVKPAERLALRDTMTFFMADAVNDRVEGDWIENYKAGTLRSQGEYDFTDVDLRGWRLNVPDLDLVA